MPNLPVVVIFGAQDISLKSLGPVPQYEARDLECYCYLNDDNFNEIIIKHKPSAIISFGEPSSFPKLNSSSFETRRRWLSFPHGADLDVVGNAAYRCFINDVCIERKIEPLVTVFTPTYKTGDKIFRPLRSLLNQKYRNWEWVIWDDSDDENHTFNFLNEISKRDYRIKLFKSHRHSGVIGEVKKWAAMVGNGEILIELDHDDEFTENAIQDVVSAFNKYPDADFAYTDCAEVFESGGNRTYSDGWAFGFGSKYDFNYNGNFLEPLRTPLPNPKTIRHIVSTPNHLRAWRKNFYQSIGGHSNLMHVADDYELCVRTFLKTKMIQIKKVGYIQYYNRTGNTQFVKNKDIQRLVRTVKELYDFKIHQRFLEFEIDDWIWNESTKSSNLYLPNIEDVKSIGYIYE